MVTKPLALPGDDRAGLHEDEDVLPARPRSRKPYPEQAVSGLESWAPPTALENGQLMSQCEDLQLQGGA
jgi:hypothetical protein